MAIFKVVLKNIITQENKKVNELEILTKADQKQILQKWNNTKVDYPREKCVHQLFEEQVGRTPEKIALIFERKKLSYRELNERSNQLAHYLQKKGVKAEVLVGICIERSIEMIVGILGVLKAGGAYVPIDPSYPAERISYILEDSVCNVLITQESIQEHLQLDAKIEVVTQDMGNTQQELYQESTANVISDACSENLIYVIYTSGSTGKPKGTLIEHKNFVNYIHWAQSYYTQNTKEWNFGLFSSISFDLTTTSMFLPLLRGAFIEIFNPKTDVTIVLDKIFKDENINSVKLTPSHISLLEGMQLGSTPPKTSNSWRRRIVKESCKDSKTIK